MSDHAPLIVDLPIASENIQVHRKVLKQDSEEEAAFLLFVSEGLSQLDFSALDSVAGLDMLSEAISGLFANCWATYVSRLLTMDLTFIFHFLFYFVLFFFYFSIFRTTWIRVY